MLLSGCHKFNITKEVAQVHERISEQMGISLEHDAEDCLVIPSVTRYMTLSDVIKISLCRNSVLHSLYDDIGIAKADMIQEGLYTNPRILSSIKIPTKNIPNFPVDLDVLTLFSVNDFWQVPRKKMIGEDELDIAILRVEKEIVAIRALAAKSYNECIVAHKQIANIKEILKDVKETHDYMVKNKRGHATEKLELNKLEAQIGEYDILLLDATNKYIVARERLRLVMGITQDEMQGIEFIEAPLLHHYHTFEQWYTAALINRIDVRAAQLKVQKEEHQLAYEDANRLKEVTVGFDVDRNEGYPGVPGGVRSLSSPLISPTFIISVPIFDHNQAQIAKAEFKLNKARKEYEAEKNKAYSEIVVNYQQLLNAHDKRHMYEGVVKSKHLTSLQHAQELFRSKQMTVDALVSAFDTYYQANDKFLTLELEERNALTSLELVAGIVLDTEPYQPISKESIINK